MINTKLKIVSLFFILIGCKNIDERILGDWCISNDFYSACYKIELEDNEIDGKVVTYYDGTSKYVYDSIGPRYIFKSLKYNDGVFVDGVSGATSNVYAKKNVTIKVKHKDTLEVKTLISNNYSSIEIWTRKTK